MKSNARAARFPARLLSLLAVAGMATARLDAAEPGLEALLKQAGDNYRTPEGHTYYDKFLDPVMEVIGRAIYSGDDDLAQRTKPLDFVFVIGADGAVKRLLYPRGTRFAEGMATRLKAIKSFPPPPHQDWAVVIHIGSTP